MTIKLGRYTLTLSAAIAIIDAAKPEPIRIDSAERERMYQQITQSEAFAELRKQAAEIKEKRKK